MRKISSGLTILTNFRGRPEFHAPTSFPGLCHAPFFVNCPLPPNIKYLPPPMITIIDMTCITNREAIAFVAALHERYFRPIDNLVVLILN